MATSFGASFAASLAACFALSLTVVGFGSVVCEDGFVGCAVSFVDWAVSLAGCFAVTFPSESPFGGSGTPTLEVFPSSLFKRA